MICIVYIVLCNVATPHIVLSGTTRGARVMAKLRTAAEIQKDWETNPRWKGVTRPYPAEEVVRLRGTVPIEHSLAALGAEKLWGYLTEGKLDYVNALGALTGNQAMQQVK